MKYHIISFADVISPKIQTVNKLNIAIDYFNKSVDEKIDTYFVIDFCSTAGLFTKPKDSVPKFMILQGYKDGILTVFFNNLAVKTDGVKRSFLNKYDALAFFERLKEENQSATLLYDVNSISLEDCKSRSAARIDLLAATAKLHNMK